MAAINSKFVTLLEGADTDAPFSIPVEEWKTVASKLETHSIFLVDSCVTQQGEETHVIVIFMYEEHHNEPLYAANLKWTEETDWELVGRIYVSWHRTKYYSRPGWHASDPEVLEFQRLCFNNRHHDENYP